MPRKTIVDKSPEDILQDEFRKVFASLTLPMEKLDQRLAARPFEERQQHYVDIRQAITNSALLKEFEEVRRHFTMVLALNECRDLERQGLRQGLLMIKYLEDRLHEVAARVEKPKPLRASVDKV